MKRERTSPLRGRHAGRRLPAGVRACLYTLLLAAVLLAANLLAASLPAGVGRVDLTGSRLYSIGEQTRAAVRALQEDVTVYWAVSPGYEDTALGEMLARYDALSARLQVQQVDPVADPTFLSRYTSGETAQNTLVVESAHRFTVLPYSALYSTEYVYNEDYTDYAAVTTFEGEGVLTGALDYVTSRSLPTVGYLVGHGEPGLSGQLLEAVSLQNIQLEELSLLNVDSVPEEYTALLLDTPLGGLYAGEADKIAAYLAGGGKLILLTGYESTDADSLEAVTGAFGLHLQPGMVLEGDAGHYYQYPFYLLPTLAENAPITQTLAQQGKYVLYCQAQAILADETLPQGVRLTPLLTSSPAAFTQAPDGVSGAQGPFDLAVLAQNEDTGGALVWFTAGALLDDELNAASADNNYTLFLSALRWLCGRETAVPIAGKSIAGKAILVPAAAAGFWRAVYTAVLPLGCLAAGAAVCLIRRRRT